MVEPRDKIQPATIDLTRPPGIEPRPAAPVARAPGRWWLPVAGLAVALALGVLFLAPELIVPERPATAAAPPPPAAGQPAPAPYSEAELAEARRAAQDILARLLPARKALEDRQVSLWGAEAFAAALSLAEEGDQLYRQREFPPALARYQQALDALEALDAELPAVIATLIAEGTQALGDGDEQRALAAFERVKAIDPGNGEADSGIARARLLPKTRPLMAKALDALAAEDLAGAAALLDQIIALDPGHREARDALATVRARQADRRFTAAMSDGLAAFQAGDLDGAARAFEGALAAKPGHPDALAGRDRARRQGEANRLAAQLADAARLEAEECWQGAAELYGAVRARDDSLVAARVGELRSRARAELDRGIAAILADPLRLSSPAVFRQGQQLLADARAIAEPGPRLRGQVEALARALDASQVPVTVRLQSDNATRVTLLRVAELGTFTRKEIDLKPGSYVALGSREGYRDVRVEFRVGEGSPTAINIQCKDPV